MKIIKAVLIISLLSMPVFAWARPSLMILGKKDATVLGKVVRLGDIADVSSREIADDEKILTLRGIEIQKSPAPGDKITISATQILEVIEKTGIDRHEIGYSFPRIISVQRASRILTLDEVRPVIEQAVNFGERQFTITQIDFPNNLRVAPGVTEVNGNLISSARGKLIIGLNIRIQDENPIEIRVPVKVDEWTMVPVAARTLSKGEVVAPTDLTMARMNLDSLSTDSTVSEKQIVGKEVQQTILAGDSFRIKSLRIPPVVTAGSKVTVSYESGPLRATATAIALEDGIEGQEVKVQNEISRRVLMANVVEPGFVRIDTHRGARQ